MEDVEVKVAVVYDFCEALSDMRFYGHLVPGKSYRIKQDEEQTNETVSRTDDLAANEG